MIHKRLFILILIRAFLCVSAGANNITVTEVNLSDRNTSANTCMVRFNVSWENSWRSTNGLSNWDAGYIFIKYRVSAASGGDGTWKQAWLNESGNIAPAGSSLSNALLSPGTAYNPASNPVIGAFIYRSNTGSGILTKNDIQLKWNYGNNSKSGTTPIGDNDIIDIRVYAVEMVYIPEGSFSLGSGGTGTSEFYKYPSTITPFQVTNEQQITVDNKNNKLYYASSVYGGDRAGPVPDLFPKGFNAFYCMKYEISQQAYVDFLNSLTYLQQTARTPLSPAAAANSYFYNANRNKIFLCTPGTASAVPAIYATDYPSVACNYLSWFDVAAWLDWSGLRPMTELEFEKTCRGSSSPASGEYAWGTTGIAGNRYTITNAGNYNEIIASNYSGLGNASYFTTTPIATSDYGPLRTGVFAGSTGNTGRVTSGSGYYGVMELSGNLNERVITIGNAKGRSYAGNHGNGLLSITGNTDIANWPATDAIGCGMRGGDWKSSASNLMVSDRTYAAYGYNGRSERYGGRGVRIAP
jgi:formylglycine-generating enzyme required for sulfatase activity